MHLHNQITPDSETFMKMVMDYPKDEKVVMVNILKFREQVKDGTETGMEAYLRYSKNMMPLLKKAEARILWSGTVKAPLIGDAESIPHMIALVEYPSISHFVEMSTSEEYKSTGKDRKIALEYGGLYASSSIPMNGGLL